MAYLDEKAQTQIVEKLADVTEDIHLIVYTHADSGRVGDDQLTYDLLVELAALNDHVTVERRILAGDTEAEMLGITMAPTVLFRERGSKRNNIRYVGVPSGHEFSTVLETIRLLGAPGERETTASITRIKEVSDEVRLRTFVTPTCPHCPNAVLTTYRFALANNKILAEAIEVTGFQALAKSYSISAVPDTAIEGFSFEAGLPQRIRGAQADHAFAQAVMEVVDPASANSVL